MKTIYASWVHLIGSAVLSSRGQDDCRRCLVEKSTKYYWVAAYDFGILRCLQLKCIEGFNGSPSKRNSGTSDPAGHVAIILVAAIINERRFEFIGIEENRRKCKGWDHKVKLPYQSQSDKGFPTVTTPSWNFKDLYTAFLQYRLIA